MPALPMSAAVAHHGGVSVALKAIKGSHGIQAQCVALHALRNMCESLEGRRAVISKYECTYVSFIDVV